MSGLVASLRQGDVVVLGQWAVVLTLFTASATYSASTTVYNLPILLFGLVTHELMATGSGGEGASRLFRMFTMFLLTSLFLDVLTLLSPLTSGLFTTLLLLLLAGLKVSLYFSSMRVLEEQGQAWRWDPRAVVESARGVVPTWGAAAAAGRGQQLGGGGGYAAPSSMPGGFTATAPPTAAAANNSFPSSGGFVLGSGDDVERGGGGGQQAPTPTATGAPGRGGYQSLP